MKYKNREHRATCSLVAAAAAAQVVGGGGAARRRRFILEEQFTGVISSLRSTF